MKLAKSKARPEERTGSEARTLNDNNWTSNERERVIDSVILSPTGHTNLQVNADLQL